MYKNVPLFGNFDSRSGSGQYCHMNLVLWTCSHRSSIHTSVEGIGSHSMPHPHGSILLNHLTDLLLWWNLIVWISGVLTRPVIGGD